ncbi:MAG TPA: Calx-beta domain-containing protein [Candidatus Saccharimonadales bacterium]|nr:Calx-beta domain-containing protein [Candidatus Saccharimonadales bacterium]
MTRTGPTDFDLPVSYRVGGTAQNGVDYEELSGWVTIPIGASEAAIVTYARFDEIVEGDESVEVAIESPACIAIFPPPRECYEIGEHGAAFGVIHDAPVTPPVVSLELVERDATETRIDQNAIFWAEFRVLRTGSVSNELSVYLNTEQGTARLGEDYWLDGVTNGSTVRFPVGASSVNVRLYPIDDDFYEGDETVFFHLIAPPPGIPLPDRYQIDFAHSSVAMVIHDNDPVATRLDITSPYNGQQFQPGDVIQLRAQIIGPGGSNSWSVDFFDGDQRLGTTQPDTPIWWGDARGGPHVITARATNSQGMVLTSAPPVTIQVGPGAVLPVAKIGATPWRTGEPCPACFFVPSILTIERTAPTNSALTVFLEIDGTATAGDDYETLPASVEIPAGQRSAQLTLLARDDHLAEGPEVVRVRVLRQPPPLQPPTYFVNVYANEALVVIFDDEPGAPQARLDIITPTNGSHLRFPSTIQLSALAVNTENEVYGPVEFYAGDQLVARSLVTASTRPAIPGLPSIHTASWTNPPVGQYALTARTRLSFSQSITSPPVNVTVDSPMLPVVSLETFPLQNAQAREFCPPNMDCAYPSFVVRRTGPTNADLSVYLSYAGTAAAGADYPALPGLLVIPAGSDAAFLTFVPNDDTLVEGNETVIATFTAVPAPYIQDPNHASATITIIDNDSSPPIVVSIGTDEAVARELSTNWPAIDSARFRISRSGDLTRDLQVFFWVGGSATSGRDYLDLYSQSPVLIPAGERSVTLDVVPRRDELIEGMESVFIELLPSPWFGPLPDYGYVVDPLNREAVGVILDAEAGPALDIAFPDDGQNFIEPPGIDIVVAAYHPTRDILGVDFYADGVKIGESRLVLDKPVPGGLIVHRFHWSNPGNGPHSLTAQGFNENGELTALSPPIHITVSPEVPPTVISIEATHPIAEEDSIPFDRLALVGVFTICRTGPTNDSVPVWIEYTGSARAGEDYPVLPAVVTIQPGAASTQIRVEPIADGIPEGIETLVATISTCPPVCPECPLPPCLGSTDPAHSSATIFIRDDGLTRASLVITNPTEGANFDIGQAILIAVTAIDLDGYISRVEFWDGEQSIGESQVDFFRAPAPGEPVQHTFWWGAAGPGAHVLTARAVSTAGIAISSAPLRITVGPGSTQPPQGTITRPVSGTAFPPEAPIEMVAETRDPDGYVHKVEFFADRRKIGESSVEFIHPPDPNQPQTFTFVWRHPEPGPHALTARATDDGGSRATSAPVSIAVGMSDPFPIVTVTVRDAWAVEPAGISDPNTATFRIRRYGPTNDALVVAYSLRGTAENRIDYDRLPGLATIPAGRRSVLVTVNPLADNLPEGEETVVLRLEETPPPGPEVGVVNPYRVGWPGVAVALISDPPAPPARPRCVVLPGHLLHICFAAEVRHNFRLEASTDLRNWETLCDTWGSDGAWHYVDTEMENQGHRFYRLTLEPVAEADE